MIPVCSPNRLKCVNFFLTIKNCIAPNRTRNNTCIFGVDPACELIFL